MPTTPAAKVLSTIPNPQMILLNNLLLFYSLNVAIESNMIPSPFVVSDEYEQKGTYILVG